MSMSRSLGAYTDVRAVLDTVLRHGTFPATYSCATKAAAVRWTHRANYFRVLCRNIEEHRHGLPHGTGTSVYDALVLSVDEATVVIRKEDSTPGILVIDGEPTEVRSNPLGEDDEPFSLKELAGDKFEL